ncbi:MAG: long-chain fatty acid--CoA ligase [Nitrospirota bacterium]|nr:long-chain fatty acid--CoA ligase [Nitrospirota bacterium]
MQRHQTQCLEQHVPATCLYPDWTVPDLLKNAATRFPDSPALFYYGTRISYRELYELTTAFARSLTTLGVKRGDRFAIMLPNIPQAVVAHYGALQAGAIVVQTNPLYLSQELETQLYDSGAHAILALDLFYSKIQGIQKRTALKHIILTGVQDFLPPFKQLIFPVKAWLSGKPFPLRKPSQTHDFRQLLETHGQPTSWACPEGPAADDLALLQYTGGTTGTPKGVMLTHRNVVANAVQCRTWMPKCLEGDEVFLGVIPFFHVYGLSTCQHLAIMTGSMLVLLPRFDVTEVLHAIEKHRVTIMSAIPMMFSKITDHPHVDRYNLRSLRICLSGASQLHAEVQDRFEKLTGVMITQGYGLTEAGPVTHCNPIDSVAPPGSIGLPFPDTDTRIVDLVTGTPLVDVGKAGELAVRGPQVMRGYWQNECETRNVLRDGWLHTGDVVRKDDQGFFFLVDRKKDMIKTRGENVYPQEVEEVLFRHAAVQDAVVLGIPDRVLGEAVKAYVVIRQGHYVTEQMLITHCQTSLARFKVPGTITFRSEFPRTVIGKVLRRTLQDEEQYQVTTSPATRKTA